MKLPKIKFPKIQNPVDVIKRLLPQAKRDKIILKEYEAERILQVDNDKDNKKFLLNLETT